MRRARLLRGRDVVGQAGSPKLVGSTRPAAIRKISPRSTRCREQRRVGAGHEGLAAERGEPLEERRAAAGVEMRGDLVEEQDRRHAAHRRRPARHARGSGRSAAPSARRSRRAPPACPSRRRRVEVAAVRPFERAPGSAVGGAALGERRGDTRAPPRRRCARRSPGRSRRQARAARRERRSVAERRQHDARGEQRRRLGAGQRHRDRVPGELAPRPHRARPARRFPRAAGSAA